MSAPESSWWALDASPTHHAVLAGWTAIAQDGIRHAAAAAELDADGATIGLLAPGEGVQLRLPLAEVDLGSEMIRTLRRWRGPEGLRHWAALLRAFSELGLRTGVLRWTLPDHLDRLGYHDRRRRDPDLRHRTARFMDFFVKIELAIYEKTGRIRIRAPLFHVLSTRERWTTDVERGVWETELVTLRINPALYSGVRQGSEIGSSWTPAPAALTEIDHVREPYAIGLGLLLLIRLRWAAGALRLTGGTLLALAAIPGSPDHPDRPWYRLGRTLEVLRAIGVISDWRWVSDPYSRAGLVELRRIIPELGPELDRVRPSIRWTGDELRSWRIRRGLTCRALATEIGVSHTSIARAESDSEGEIGARLRRALSQLAPELLRRSADEI